MRDAAGAAREPEEQVAFLLKRLMHQFRHQMDQQLRQNADLSLAHLATLDRLEHEQGVAGAQLARKLFVTAQTMTGLLRYLERSGCVERRSDPGNRRADRWFLLPAGHARLACARKAGIPVMSRMLSRLQPAEVDALLDYLGRCVEGLEREGLAPP